MPVDPTPAAPDQAEAPRTLSADLIRRASEAILNAPRTVLVPLVSSRGNVVGQHEMTIDELRDRQAKEDNADV